MRVTIKPEEYDFRKYLEWAVRNDPNLKRVSTVFRRRMIVLGVILGIVVCGFAWIKALGSAGTEMRSFALEISIAWIIGLLGMVVVRPAKSALVVRLFEASRHKFPFMLAAAQLDTAQDGMHEETAYTRTVYLWDSFACALLVETRLFCIRGDDSCVIVPKRCFESDEQFNGFCETVWEHVPRERPPDA